MPHMLMKHEKDPAEELVAALGDLSGVEIFHNQVLVAVYLRPQQTASGLFLTDQTRNEDIYQSKVGLLVKAGGNAFQREAGSSWFTEALEKPFELGKSWLVFRPSESWSITINNVVCRIVDDINIRGRVSHPDTAW